jgi:Purple acid Phosphatase, N-terminal domain/Iron/zinc purple acid phosphatase-like protein C
VHRCEHGGRAALAAALAGLSLAASPSGALAADTSPPTQPGAITASSVTATAAKLSWGRSTDDVGIEGYRVYRGPAGATDSALELIATTDAVTSYPAAKLYSATGYRFGVVAIDAANNLSPMRTVTLTTAGTSDTSAPAAPSSASVSAKAFSSSRIDVVWGASASTDVAGYRVIRDGTVVATVNLPGGLRWSDNGLAASSAHTYAIAAVDSARNVSAATPVRSATTLATGTVRVARGPYLSNVTGTSAVLSWWTNIPSPGVASWGVGTATEHSLADPAGSVRHHSVTITGLAPGTTYRYQVGDGAGVISGATFPTAAAPGTPFSFAAIGDFGGGGSGATQNGANIAAAGTSFVQTVGDNIYPAAGNPDPDFATTYSDFDQRFYKPMGAAIKSQAFFPANGNKEYYGDGVFWANFPMPGTNHSWYAYDWGDAHIVVLDSELPMDAGSPQYDFLAQDLAAHQSAAWRIVAVQRPPYSSSSPNASSTRTGALVPLFQQQHVTLVLSGNSHNYERSFPLIDGTAAAGGITYVVTGAGGNGFNSFTLAAPAWSAFREATEFEFLRVGVSPAAIQLDAIAASTNTVLDSATITKPATTVSVAPTADATIQEATAVNAGTSTRLTADNSPVSDFLLRFTVPTSCASVRSATLTLTVGTGADNGSVKGGDVYGTSDNGWTESTVVWGTAPPRSGAAVATLGAVTAGTAYTVDVSGLVTRPGTVSMRVGTTSGDAAAYWSRERSAAEGPRLQLTC